MTENEDLNRGADYWRFRIGANVFPSDSKNKVSHIRRKRYYYSPISLEQHEKWKREGAFSKGLGVAPGKVLHRIDKLDYYLISIEWDRSLGFDELFEGESFEKVSKKHLIEQHVDVKSRGHLWIYSPIQYPRKNPDNVLGLEVKSAGEHGIIMSSPSLHKDGFRYQAQGTLEPYSYSREEALELLLRIDAICRKHNIEYLVRNGNDSNRRRTSPLSTSLKNMLRELVIDKTIKIYDGQRHVIMIAIANFILLKHWQSRSHDELRKYLNDINEQVCTPNSLPEKEIDSIWSDAIEFTSKILKEKRLKEVDDDGIPQEIRAQFLDKHVYRRVAKNPVTLFVADEDQKAIIKAVVQSSVSTVETSDTDYFETISTTTSMSARYVEKAIMMDCIPKAVTIYENPLDGNSSYEVTFIRKCGKPFTAGPGTAGDLLERIKDKRCYLAARETEQALVAILTAYEDSGRANLVYRVPYSGYFYQNGSIVGYDITQKYIDPVSNRNDKDEMIEGIYIFEELYKKMKDKSIFVTAFKWSLSAPFSFVKKQMSNAGNKWSQGIHLHGESQTGKNTKGKIALAVWRKHYLEDENIHFVGFGNVNSEAKLEYIMSRTTYSLIINEAGDLASDKNISLVELLKHTVESLTVRGAHRQNRRYGNGPALRNVMLTSNPLPPKDMGYRNRYVSLHYDQCYRTTDPQKEDFNRWFYTEGRIDKLGIFGDFARKYIIENPDELKTKHWSELGKGILSEFYKVVCKEPPVWISTLEKADVVKESTEDRISEIRGFLEQAILEGHRKIYGPCYGMDLREKLKQCLQGRGTPYLAEVTNKLKSETKETTKVVIMRNIIPEIQRRRIVAVTTLTTLANEIPGFEYKSMRLSKYTKPEKLAYGSYDDLLKFLGWPNMDEEEQEKEKPDDPLRPGLYRTELEKDWFACHYCKAEGDLWKMQSHFCNQEK